LTELKELYQTILKLIDLSKRLGIAEPYTIDDIIVRIEEMRKEIQETKKELMKYH
jgi:hypothetical protein